MNTAFVLLCMHLKWTGDNDEDFSITIFIRRERCLILQHDFAVHSTHTAPTWSEQQTISSVVLHTWVMCQVQAQRVTDAVLKTHKQTSVPSSLIAAAEHFHHALLEIFSRWWHYEGPHPSQSSVWVNAVKKLRTFKYYY